jgi:hypothetical protein
MQHRVEHKKDSLDNGGALYHRESDEQFQPVKERTTDARKSTKCQGVLGHQSKSNASTKHEFSGCRRIPLGLLPK